METTLKNSNDNGIVKLSEDMTIQHITKICDVLIKALKANDKIFIEFGNVTHVDLAGLQLMCAAHRIAILTGKQISCSGTLPDVFRKAAEEAGYDRLTGCRRDDRENCFWMPQIKAGNSQ